MLPAAMVRSFCSGIAVQFCACCHVYFQWQCDTTAAALLHVDRELTPLLCCVVLAVSCLKQQWVLRLDESFVLRQSMQCTTAC